ncbi:MAG: glycosyltransferase family 2 protein, partial [Metallosphaera sp.]
MLFIDIIIVLSAILSSLWILLESFYYTREKPSVPRTDGPRYRTSIVVAIKNEDPEVVKGLVENLSRLDYPDYEVILVS